MHRDPDVFLSFTGAAECPDQSSGLQPWSPGHNRDHRVSIGQGSSLLLTSSATVHSIHISDGGEPVPPRVLSSPLPRASQGHRHFRWTGQSYALGSCWSILFLEITIGSEHVGEACLSTKHGEERFCRAKPFLEFPACQLILPSEGWQEVRQLLCACGKAERRGKQASTEGFEQGASFLLRQGGGLGCLPLVLL